MFYILHRFVNVIFSYTNGISVYSEIPLLRPLKIKTSYLLKTLPARFKLLFFFIFYVLCTSDKRPPLGLSKSGL